MGRMARLQTHYGFSIYKVRVIITPSESNHLGMIDGDASTWNGQSDLSIDLNAACLPPGESQTTLKHYNKN